MIAAVIGTLSMQAGRWQSGLLATGSQVEGTVISALLVGSQRRSNESHVTVQYFTPDGRDHSFSFPAVNTSRYRPGERVTVYDDPRQTRAPPHEMGRAAHGDPELERGHPSTVGGHCTRRASRPATGGHRHASGSRGLARGRGAGIDDLRLATASPAPRRAGRRWRHVRRPANRPCASAHWHLPRPYRQPRALVRRYDEGRHGSGPPREIATRDRLMADPDRPACLTSAPGRGVIRRRQSRHRTNGARSVRPRVEPGRRA